MLDYGPPETERRERWLTAIGLALVLQFMAGIIIVLVGLLTASEDMGATLSVRRWHLPVAVTAVTIFLLSGFAAATITQSKRAWLVLLGPPLFLLVALALRMVG